MDRVSTCPQARYAGQLSRESVGTLCCGYIGTRLVRLFVTIKYRLGKGPATPVVIPACFQSVLWIDAMHVAILQTREAQCSHRTF